jgi:hypothetical protein
MPPKSFQRLVDRVGSDLDFMFVHNDIYNDDILVASREKSTHLGPLHLLLDVV